MTVYTTYFGLYIPYCHLLYYRYDVVHLPSDCIIPGLFSFFSIYVASDILTAVLALTRSYTSCYHSQLVGAVCKNWATAIPE